MSKHSRIILLALAAFSDLLGAACIAAYVRSTIHSENLLFVASLTALCAIIFLLACIAFCTSSHFGYVAPVVTQFGDSQQPLVANSIAHEQMRQRWETFMARIDSEERYYCKLANGPCPVWASCEPQCCKKSPEPANQTVVDS